MENKKIDKLDKNQKSYIASVGRKKEAVARVRLYKDFKSQVYWGDKKINKGDIFVNGVLADDYFTDVAMRKMFFEPISIVGANDKYALTIKVTGGGIKGQLGACVHGISRALILINEDEYKPMLRKKGLLTRDYRTRQRRMVGTGGKARRMKQSPKR